jgi:predicted alpha/beta superfamily hydrolase
VVPAPTGSYSMSHVPRFLTLLLLSVLGTQRLVFAQEVSAKLGVARTIKSAILNEDRKVLVHLPANYDTSGKPYPVLYLLDGTEAFLLEMIAITNRLRNDRNAPEMIIVAIENTNRDRDMMPVVAKDYPGPPRAEAFLGFLEKELVPDIETTYRTAQPRILQGKSLSGLFIVYALLARPTVFNAYVACSAGWFAENNEYFRAMSNRAFQKVESFANRRVFMANSLRDQYDPDQTIHREMIEFSGLVKDKLGEAISYRYETYQDYPHVPFPCLYDGLRFVTAEQPKK